MPIHGIRMQHDWERVAVRFRHGFGFTLHRGDSPASEGHDEAAKMRGTKITTRRHFAVMIIWLIALFYSNRVLFGRTGLVEYDLWQPENGYARLAHGRSIESRKDRARARDTLKIGELVATSPAEGASGLARSTSCGLARDRERSEPAHGNAIEP